jgi:hypothetical protein
VCVRERVGVLVCVCVCVCVCVFCGKIVRHGRREDLTDFFSPSVLDFYSSRFRTRARVRGATCADYLFGRVFGTHENRCTRITITEYVCYINILHVDGSWILCSVYRRYLYCLAAEEGDEILTHKIYVVLCTVLTR